MPRMTIPGTDPGRRRLARLADAAAYANCSAQTIRRRVADGTLTGYTLGPRILRVDLNELDAVLGVVPTAAISAHGR